MTVPWTGRTVRGAGGLLLALSVLIVMPSGFLAGQFQPPPPEDLEATAVGPTQVDLVWSPPEVDDDDDDEFVGTISHYNVYRDGERVGSAEETAFSDMEVEPDTRYDYRVTAVSNFQVESEPSKRARVTTPPLDTVPPTVPRDLEATPVDPRRVELTWSASEDELSPVDHYRVFRDGSSVGTTAETVFTDGGLEPSTTYTYRVSAVDTAGNESEPSDPAEATTPAEPDTTPPTIPEELRTTAVESTRVDLAWSASRDDESGVDHYRVFRDDSGIGTTVDTSFSDGGLEPGTTYSYQVSAVNGDGEESGLSEPLSVTTDGSDERDTTPPAPPTDLRVEP